MRADIYVPQPRKLALGQIARQYRATRNFINSSPWISSYRKLVCACRGQEGAPLNVLVGYPASHELCHPVRRARLMLMLW